MVEPPSPEQFEELAAGYVLGNLTPEEAEQFRQQLVAYPELMQEVETMQQVLEVMPYALPDSRPPDQIHAAILQAIEKERNQASDPGYSIAAPKSSLPGKRMLQGWGVPMAIAATLVAAGLGWTNYQLQQQVSALQNQVTKQSDVIAMLQQPQAQLVALKGMQPTSPASGSMVMTPNKPQAILVLQNLPVLPEGQYYQIWCIWGQKKLPWSSFSTDDRGTALLKLPLPDNIPVKTLAITVEGSPNPSAPGGPMVMTSAL